MIGDGAHAESHLKWGKTISCSLNLPFFTVAFSSSLGIKIACTFFSLLGLLSFRSLVGMKLICNFCGVFY